MERSIFKTFESVEDFKTFESAEGFMTILKSSFLALVLALRVNAIEPSQKAIEMTNRLKNNKEVKASQLQLEKAEASIKTAYTFDKTNVYYSYDQNNLAINNQPLRVFGIQQKFEFHLCFLLPIEE